MLLCTSAHYTSLLSLPTSKLLLLFPYILPHSWNHPVSQFCDSNKRWDCNKVLIVDDETKADLLNDHFVAQSTLQAENQDLEEAQLPESLLEPFVVMPEDVYKILNGLDVNKATGPDGISNKLLKEAAVPIAQPLSELLNFCLSFGSFPQTWKVAQVVPIFKKDDPQLCNNYRPISLLSCLSKVFEKLVFNHMFGFVKSNNILNVNQSGFIPGDSTVNQLMTICHNIASHFDSGDELVAVFLDLTKAFDKVWHKGLLHKLRKVGIHGQVYQLLSSYLESRQQFVTINGQTSETRGLTSGVPQGSVLGPLLFLIYINDINENVSNPSFLFADDTSVFGSIQNSDATLAIANLNQDLNEIHKWSKKWLVEINPSKTVAMLFSIKQQPTQLTPILLDNKVVPLVSVHKHLGMYFTPTLNWSTHIDHVTTKCHRTLNMLKKFKYRWSRRALETCYTSFVRPILEYGCIVYDSCSEGDSEKLEEVQLKAARLATGAKKRTSHGALYRELGWTPLKDRRAMFKLIKMFNVVKHSVPFHIARIISLYQRIPVVHTRSTDQGILQLPRCNTTIFQSSPILSSMTQWNDTNMCLRSINSLAVFRSRLKAHYRRSPSLFKHDISRKKQITFMQIRMGFSNLNQDLFLKGCTANPGCSCGASKEDAKHFLLMCPLYMDLRSNLFTKLKDISSKLTPKIETLLYGSNSLSENENLSILENVCHYISETGRFHNF